ncbi:MAG: ATP synthase protein I [Paracoccaceae bacterium]|jgi:ATP synthase protein I
MAAADDPADERLKDLDARLSEVRRRRAPPKPRKGGGRLAGHDLAWSMVIDLTAGIVVGGALGWGLDSLLGTMPLFLIVLVLLGFAAGIRVMLQSAKEHGRRMAARAAAADEQDGAKTDKAAPAGAAKRNNGATAPRNEGL